MPPPPSKRRRLLPLSKTGGQPLTLDFDPSARQEYLSGFSKRKTARKEAAREQAIKRDREERVKERAQLRQQRKEDLKAHVEAVDAVLSAQRGDMMDGEDDEEWDGVDEEPETADIGGEEEEYVDEEKYTTVTVEAMPSSTTQHIDDELELEGLAKKAAAEEAAREREKAEKSRKLKPWEKPRWDGKEKKKKPKFRYETKAERAVGRMKAKSKNSKAASARRGAEKS